MSSKASTYGNNKRLWFTTGGTVSIEGLSNDGVILKSEFGKFKTADDFIKALKSVFEKGGFDIGKITYSTYDVSFEVAVKKNFI